MAEHFDTDDYKRLLEAILRQAIDDYIKLQHPKYRTKKYLDEAFQSAVDLFFDSKFRLLSVKNEDGKDMSLKDMLRSMTELDKFSVQKLKQYVIDEARKFWENKTINTIQIPDTVIVDGHVYSVFSAEEDDPYIDFDEHLIFVDKHSEKSENQEAFMKQLLEIAAYHEELQISKVNLEKLGRIMFRIMRMNSCFTGE